MHNLRVDVWPWLPAHIRLLYVHSQRPNVYGIQTATGARNLQFVDEQQLNFDVEAASLIGADIGECSQCLNASRSAGPSPRSSVLLHLVRN
jgi:Na+/phosphate symporter